ncbi:MULTISPECIES: signal recognition particle-docking protein FtsY [unclassified Akkermansia]|mgnify:FL=1|jgi:fused signal recognition particle receptor|uniref:signal recognition particle-docking protein FtsY n=1 Tax=unclassified Akkermansia TaxID=2608915 RepID=UPI000E8F622D|nr:MULTISPECIES: signal recognition particle-docking protein FtsY [unclassified Akkermansia]HBN16829.1 signal recognition particle-docking protein FtsY [Akkermansia sp.]
MAGFFKKLFTKFSRSSRIDWDELEADLVAADIGIRRAMGIVDQLKESKGLNAENLVESTREALRQAFPSAAPALPVPPEGKPLVILVVGVNGTGKTTSAAKLAHLLQKQGSRVLLAAADTFRAAAVEQLQSWADKLNIPIYKGAPGQDPASVCYEAHTRAIREGFPYLICDTAGRLHTRHNLMEELSKIRRTLAKQDADAPHHTLLVVDATTGANALAQAREFHKATPLDSVMITKMDGSGKGGVAVAIMDEMHIPPSFLGTGEGAEDFEPFNRDRYVDSLL